MSRKMIIIASGAGLLTFGVAFVAAWMIGHSRASAPQHTTTQQQAVPGTTGAQQTASGQETISANSPLQSEDEKETERKLDDKQLKNLVFEVREKIREYENKAKELEVREARLQITQETLKKDIEELNRMRVEMAALAANLKEQRSKLLETRTEIAQSEKANLASIAATYDKMDSASASKILSSMCAKQMDAGRLQGGAVDDAVKILFYMTERTKAKLLAEMVNSEPKLAAVLCQRLKLISEGK
jgi:flagellar motility protein MotE (MotC chaperone)